jgi:hypothetical protein
VLTRTLMLLALIAAAPAASAGSDLIFRSAFEDGTWVDATGEAFWQCRANCNIVAGQFVDSGGGMALEVVGTWADGGFSPRAVRVDASESPMLTLSVGLIPGGIDFGSCSNYLRLDVCPLQVTESIRRINLYQSGTVRKIEFLVFD